MYTKLQTSKLRLEQDQTPHCSHEAAYVILFLQLGLCYLLCSYLT